MIENKKRSIPLPILGLAGLLISLLAAVREYIPFIQFLCTTACRETSQITFFLVPVWAWGVLLWTGVLFVAWFARDAVPWIAAPAAGLEAALVWIMLRMRAPCVFCIANLVTVVLLVAFSFRRKLLWQQATLALLFHLVSVSWIPHENRLFDSSLPRDGSAIGDDMVAKVGDETITDHRLEVLLGTRLVELKREIYRLKREKVDELIVEYVIQKEAKEKRETVEQIVDEAAADANSTVSDQDVDRYLQENAERLKDYQGPATELRARLKTILEQQKRSQAINTYVRSLDQKYGGLVNLPVPQMPNVTVDITDTRSLGPIDAPVMVIEFGDYACPPCRSTHETVKKIRETFGNQIRWIFRDYPLRMHKEAFKAAEAGHCAADQGKFWEFQNLAFTRDKLDVESLIKYGSELGISADTFRKCLQENKYKELVDRSLQVSTRAGIEGTPSFIINGNLFNGGLTFEVFKAKIEEELKKAAPKP